MIRAYTVIDTAAGMAETVCETVQELDCVTEAYVVTGDFDVIVELEGARTYDLLYTVTSQIRPLDGVGTTRTYVCLDDSS